MKNAGNIDLKTIIDFHLFQVNNLRSVGELIMFLHLDGLIDTNKLKDAKLPLNYWRDLFNKSKSLVNSPLSKIAEEKLKLSPVVIKEYADEKKITFLEAIVVLKAKRILCKDDIESFYAIGDENIKIREKILQIFSILDELKSLET